MSTMESAHRHTGRVKFFNSVKGFGFIIPNGSEGQEVFVHYTAIYNDGGFKSLAEGEEVEYNLVQGPKGMQAAEVTGPNGGSVLGDPGPMQQQPQYPSGSYNRSPYDNNSGYMEPYIYGLPTGFAPHNFAPQMYAQQQQQQQQQPPFSPHYYNSNSMMPYPQPSFNNSQQNDNNNSSGNIEQDEMAL